MLKYIRYISWTAVVIAAAVASWLFLSKQFSQESVHFSKDFALTKTDGSNIDGKEFIGRPHLVFFGFTHCPEICPTTLYEASNWMAQLGDDADKLDIYFISVDPERDTPELLSEYMSAFDKRIIGLTGTVASVDKAAKAFHVYYRKVDLDDGDYTMDHTASVFLMKADGSFKGTIAWQENSDTALTKIKNLLDN